MDSPLDRSGGKRRRYLGTICLLRSEITPPNRWPLARIVKLQPGKERRYWSGENSSADVGTCSTPHQARTASGNRRRIAAGRGRKHLRRRQPTQLKDSAHRTPRRSRTTLYHTSLCYHFTSTTAACAVTHCTSHHSITHTAFTPLAHTSLISLHFRYTARIRFTTLYSLSHDSLPTRGTLQHRRFIEHRQHTICLPRASSRSCAHRTKHASPTIID